MKDRLPLLTVRVKLVDLNHADRPSATLPPRSSGASVSALMGSATERPSRLRSVGVEAGISVNNPTGEVCMTNGRAVPFGDFENHIERCPVCSSRVDLQLDFIETLEAAMYQRRSEPESSKIHGALLVSAPQLKFAICGEIDF